MCLNRSSFVTVFGGIRIFGFFFSTGASGFFFSNKTIGIGGVNDFSSSTGTTLPTLGAESRESGVQSRQSSASGFRKLSAPCMTVGKTGGCSGSRGMSYSFRGSQSAGAESDGFVGLTAGRMSVGMVKIGGATEGLVMRGRKLLCQRERKRSFSEGELVKGGHAGGCAYHLVWPRQEGQSAGRGRREERRQRGRKRGQLPKRKEAGTSWFVLVVAVVVVVVIVVLVMDCEKLFAKARREVKW